jgi:hypothetical protein
VDVYPRNPSGHQPREITNCAHRNQGIPLPLTSRLRPPRRLLAEAVVHLQLRLCRSTLLDKNILDKNSSTPTRERSLQGSAIPSSPPQVIFLAHDARTESSLPRLFHDGLSLGGGGRRGAGVEHSFGHHSAYWSRLRYNSHGLDTKAKASSSPKLVYMLQGGHVICPALTSSSLARAVCVFSMAPDKPTLVFAAFRTSHLYQFANPPNGFDTLNTGGSLSNPPSIDFLADSL